MLLPAKVMASAEASRRASVASSSEMSLQEPFSNKAPFVKKDKVTGAVNLKKSITKKAKPKDIDGAKTAGTTRSPSPNSPAINGNGPKVSESTETVVCKHCKKPMSESVAETHTPLCLEKKKEKARKKKEAKEARLKEAKAKEAAEEKEKRDKDADSIMDDIATAVGGEGGEEGSSAKKPPKKSASKNAPDGPKKSKKRKADEGGGDKEPKKKKLKKDEPPKPKIPKPKGPVNVEQQCGVPLNNGAYCARSLTCKSHSMGAKRAVPGRSAPYDQLLAMYQKRNQAKLQKAALSAAAPLPDDEPATGPVDSDEEKDTVMAAIARSRPMPLEQHISVPTARKYMHIRRKEMLGNALGVKGASYTRPGGEVAPQEGVNLPTAPRPAEPVNGDSLSRRASMVLHGPGQQNKTGTATTGAGGASSRKASVTSNGGS